MNKQNIYHPSQHTKQPHGTAREATKLHKGNRLGCSLWLLETSRPHIGFRPKKARSRSAVDPRPNFLFSVRGQRIRPRTDLFEGNGVLWRMEKDGQSRNGSKPHGI